MTERKPPAYLEQPVTIEPGAIRMSAEAMRSLKKATGRSMTELLQDDDDEANKFQCMAFAQLHRRAAALGHLPDAAVLWDQAGLIDIDFVVEDALADPLGAGSSPISPPSATSGG